MDPHSIGRLDPDPHSECGSGSRWVKKSSNEEKNAAKSQIISHKSIKNQYQYVSGSSFQSNY
jgi:hypothetical protein